MGFYSWAAFSFLLPSSRSSIGSDDVSIGSTRDKSPLFDRGLRHVDDPQAFLHPSRARPPNAALDEIMESFRQAAGGSTNLFDSENADRVYGFESSRFFQRVTPGGETRRQDPNDSTYVPRSRRSIRGEARRSKWEVRTYLCSTENADRAYGLESSSFSSG
jgi:hypothetical protein